MSKNLRRVRPTLRVMKDLPATPTVVAAQTVIGRARGAADLESAKTILRELRLESLDCALIDDANRIMETGVISRHEESTAAYGATVHEARDHTGAGHRGAVIVYRKTEPWLVHVDKHDKFHASATAALRRTVPQQRANSKMPFDPTDLDDFVLEVEEDRLQTFVLQCQVIENLLSGLRAAHDGDGTASLRTPEDPEAAGEVKSVPYTLEIVHDEPAETVDLASASFSTITLLIPYGQGPGSMHNMLIQCGVIFLQPDLNYHNYLEQEGAVEIELTVTHAKLAQLLSDNDLDDTNVPPSVSEPTHLHWVNSGDHIEGSVLGTAIQSLCGRWLVPLYNETADLPVCERCEQLKPHASALLEALRARG